MGGTDGINPYLTGYLLKNVNLILKEEILYNGYYNGFREINYIILVCLLQYLIFIFLKKKKKTPVGKKNIYMKLCAHFR